MKRLVASTLLPLALGLLAGPDGRAQAQPCRPVLAAQAPLADDSFFINAPVTIAGQATRMIVDTGSQGSLLTPEGMAALGLHPDTRHLTMVEGAGGRAALSPNIGIPALRIGGLDLGARSVPAGALPGLPRLAPPILGLMGADMWRGLDLELDVPRHVLRLWTVPAACRFAPDWPSGSFESLVAVPVGGRLLVPFTLDGLQGRALVDSGARSLIVSRGFVRRLGISDAALAQDRGGVTSGVDINARLYVWHRFGSLTLGGTASRSPVLTVSDLHDSADMLLGAAWFAHHDVWLSYGQERVFVRSSP